MDLKQAVELGIKVAEFGAGVIKEFIKTKGHATELVEGAEEMKRGNLMPGAQKVFIAGAAMAEDAKGFGDREIADDVNNAYKSLGESILDAEHRKEHLEKAAKASISATAKICVNAILPAIKDGIKKIAEYVRSFEFKSKMYSMFKGSSKKIDLKAAFNHAINGIKKVFARFKKLFVAELKNVQKEMAMEKRVEKSLLPVK